MSRNVDVPCCVYEHWRPDRDEPFYVGQGAPRRANSMKKSRNSHHRAVQEKLAQLGMCVEVRLVADGLTKAGAEAIEVKRIAFWRARGIDLVNMNEGGHGGINPNDEVRAKLSKIHKGKKISPEMREKLRISSTGRRHSAESLAKMVAANKGRKRTPEQIEKMRGRKVSAATGAKISAAKKGKSLSPLAMESLMASWTPERRAAQADVTAKRAAYMNAVRTTRGRGPMPQTTRDALLKANRGRKMKPHLVEAQRGPRPEKTKEKMRIAWTPERREAQAKRCALVAGKRAENKSARKVAAVIKCPLFDGIK